MKLIGCAGVAGLGPRAWPCSVAWRIDSSHPAVRPTCVRRWISEDCNSFLPIQGYNIKSFILHTASTVTVLRHTAEDAILQVLF
jgi:hypothetical protein